MSESEEENLVSDALRGDRESFERLVKLYQKAVFNVAYRLLNNYEDARDVTQNAFLKAFQNLGGFDPGCRFFSWIYRIAINESINLRNSRKPQQEVDERVADGRALPDASLSSTELSREIQRALMSLQLGERAVIVLRHFDHCSYQDIGEILGIPEKTVRSRLFSARDHLRNVLIRKGIL